jgi:hypothetical protein
MKSACALPPNLGLASPGDQDVPELLRVEAAECRLGAIGKSARIERTLLALADRLESRATVLEARESADQPQRQEIMRNLPGS